jgi:hypothetical protein
VPYLTEIQAAALQPGKTEPMNARFLTIYCWVSFLTAAYLILEAMQ